MALYSLYHDVDLELNWISEHHPVADITNYGRSLAGAVSLLQKHKVQLDFNNFSFNNFQ